MSEESKRAPVRIEILSSAENIPLIDKDLHEVLRDASVVISASTWIRMEKHVLR
jgi:hypothetical protein